MSLIVLPWLPAAAQDDLDIVVRRVTEKWLADWVEDPVAIDVVSPAHVDGQVGDWLGSPGRWLHIAEDDLIALGMEGCAGRADRINLLDRELLVRVGDEMLADLAARLGSEADASEARKSGTMSRARESAEGATHRFCVTAATQGWTLLITLDESTVVRLRKAVAGGVRELVLAPLSKALADETIRLGCYLGQTEITAAELSALVIGDVLVLDRRLDAPVPLTVEGSLPRKGKARIAAKIASIEVRLTEPIEIIQGN